MRGNLQIMCAKCNVPVVRWTWGVVGSQYEIRAECHESVDLCYMPIGFDETAIRSAWAFKPALEASGRRIANALNQPEAKENNGRNSARLEAAEGQQGSEDTEESREGVQPRGREEGEA